MALEGSSKVASTHLDLSVPTNMAMLESATPTTGVTTLGFIISLCMVEQCLKYDDDNIKGVYIYHNYNITKIPANAFLWAAYLEVSWHSIQKYIMHTFSLKWRHDERDGVSNHRRLDCLLKRCWGADQRKHQSSGEGNLLVTSGFPSQRASNAKNASIWWRHHVKILRPSNSLFYNLSYKISDMPGTVLI